MLPSPTHYQDSPAPSLSPSLPLSPSLFLSLSLSWYFWQGVSPFHDWRNISGQSGLFCIKTTPHLHNLRMSSSLLIAASEGHSPVPPPVPPPPIPRVFQGR